jgi:hypothetical protein
MKFVDTTGRIDRFRKKYGAVGKKAKEAAAAAEEAPKEEGK